jgi:hypothetical protein
MSTENVAPKHAELTLVADDKIVVLSIDPVNQWVTVKGDIALLWPNQQGSEAAASLDNVVRQVQAMVLHLGLALTPAAPAFGTPQDMLTTALEEGATMDTDLDLPGFDIIEPTA